MLLLTLLASSSLIANSGTPQRAPRAWVDLTGEGKLSLYVQGGPSVPDRIFVPGAGGKLLESTELCGLAARPGALDAIFVDVDGDGRIDVVRLLESAPLEVLRLNAAGTFDDVTRDVGLENVSAESARVLDFDADGRADLELETGAGVVVYRNRGGVFETVLELVHGSEGHAASSPVVAPAIEETDDLAPVPVGLHTPGSTGASAGRPGLDLGGTSVSATDAASAPADPEAIAALCLPTITDQATGLCVDVSSVPQLGSLYPLSSDFHLDGAGNVNLGAALSGARLTADEDAAGNAILGRSTQGTGVGVVGENLALIGDAIGVEGRTSSSDGTAIHGHATSSAGSAVGIHGRSNATDGIGVYGESLTGAGTSFGVVGRSPSAGGAAVFGHATSAGGPTRGLLGITESPSGRAIHGEARATSGSSTGVDGESLSPDGVGVSGRNLATSGDAVGVFGETSASSGIGVRGVAQTVPFVGGGTGVLGEGGIGVVGESTMDSGGVGVRGETLSTLGVGVVGSAGPTPVTFSGSGVSGSGEFGVSGTGTSIGVQGFGDEGMVGVGDTIGVRGESGIGTTLGTGMKANGGYLGLRAEGGSIAISTFTAGIGVDAYGGQHGVRASSDGTSALDLTYTGSSGSAVLAYNASFDSDTSAVEAVSNGGTTLLVDASNNSTPLHVFSDTLGSTLEAPSAAGAPTLTVNSAGTLGTSLFHNTASSAATDDVTLRVASGNGFSPTEIAGAFLGDVDVTHNLSKGGGSFKIDHPLDPRNKYLYHSFVESPEMLNVYNGNVVLDGDGAARVELPPWFGALNRDYRYQLTPLGQPAALYVSREVAENTFEIAGGVPGQRVSWQVTGVRQDAYANANRIPVEEPKPPAERGTYLHGHAFGHPELSRDYVLYGSDAEERIARDRSRRSQRRERRAR